MEVLLRLKVNDPLEAASHRLTAVTGRRFLDSLRVSDARFAVADKEGMVRLIRTPPALNEVTKIGPCFVLASREPGAAGVLPLQVVGVMSGAVRPPVIFEQTTLVTDGPSVFAPGFIDVGMSKGMPEDVTQNFVKQIPLGRLGDVKEIVDAALFLASPMASYITGHVLNVNGGFYMG